MAPVRRPDADEGTVHNGKLRIGLVGAGAIGRDEHLPAWTAVPFAEVVAVADTSAAALEHAGRIVPEAATSRDWRQLIDGDGLDVIDICTPNRTHAEIALAALESGKHVLCEKPLTTTSAEVVRLRDATRRAGRLLMTAQHLRFQSASRQLKAWLGAGLVGDVYYARAQWLRRRWLPARATFTDRRLSGGGPTFDIGVHVLDLAFWFMGAPRPVSVSAALGTHLARREDLAGDWGDWDRTSIDVEDFAAGFVRFANGASLTLETSWLSFQPEKEMVRLQCYGTRGGLLWPDAVLTSETRRAPWDLKFQAAGKGRPHREAIRQFAQAVRDGGPSPVPVEETLEVTRILEGFYRSSTERREVLLEPIAAEATPHIAGALPPICELKEAASISR
jgi:predicted dehydrogenase